MRAQHTSPGPDGVAYAFWRAAGYHASRTLFLIAWRLRGGLPMPVAFYANAFVFPGKGTEDQDSFDVSRSASNVRPLSLNNSDNKAVCGVLNRSLRQISARHVCNIQRGFEPGRQFGNNISNFDSEDIILSRTTPSGQLRLLAFWDTAAALPSLQHVLIWQVLSAIGVPPKQS